MVPKATTPTSGNWGTQTLWTNLSYNTNVEANQPIASVGRFGCVALIGYDVGVIRQIWLKCLGSPNTSYWSGRLRHHSKTLTIQNIVLEKHKPEKDYKEKQQLVSCMPS